MSDTRRSTVLDSALTTFARHGFRRTSMDAVASAAGISRQGLYFLFDSKESLFRESAAHAVAQDLAAAERVLDDHGPALDARLLDAFDLWAGRWVGPGVRDVPAVVEANPALLDTITTAAPARFERLIETALADSTARPADLARTLVRVSVGLKHEVEDRDAYRSGLRIALELLGLSASSDARPVRR